jgi:DNA-binding GntR family transcriptional regulator
LNLAEAIEQLRPRVCSETHRLSLEALLERAAKLRSKPDTDELWRINNERHRIVTQLIGNSALRLMYDYFFHLTIRAWFELVTEMWDDQVDALCTELTDLIRAVKFGDTEAVAHVERNHLSYHMVLIGRFMSGKPGSVASVER